MCIMPTALPVLPRHCIPAAETRHQIGRIANATEESERTVIYYQPDYRLAAMEIAILLEVDAQLIEGSYGSNNPVAVLLGRDLNGGN